MKLLTQQVGPLSTLQPISNNFRVAPMSEPSANDPSKNQ